MNPDVVPVSVEDVMGTAETAPPDDTVGKVVRRFVELGLESITIVDDGDSIGIVTRSDFVSLIASNESITRGSDKEWASNSC